MPNHLLQLAPPRTPSSFDGAVCPRTGTTAHGVVALNTDGIALPLTLGIVHFVVDASSNFVVARLLHAYQTSDWVALLFLYNLLAFALQPLAGLATDLLRAPRGVMAAGLLIASAAMVLGDAAGVLALVLTGIGNSLFHVGAGTIASNATRGRAIGPGIFLGPGAIGVVLGAAAGRSWPSAFWPLLVSLVVFAPVGISLPDPKARSDRALDTQAQVPERSSAILCLLLLAIAFRAFLGARIGSQLVPHAGPSLVFALAIAACVGKVLGGTIADRVGWKRSAIGFLLASALLVSSSDAGTWVGLCGVALFQAVTSITLASLYRVLPTSMGLGFGLACLALFVGSLPVLFRVDLGWLERAPLNALVSVLSAVAVWGALHWLEDSKQSALATLRVSPRALP